MKATLAAAFAGALLLGPASAYAQGTPPAFVTVQPSGQWLASQFIGQPVTNQAGERIGDINDLLFDKSGRIANVVIGVGGFLGMGEKNVALPYGDLAITADASGKRVVQIAASKDLLQSAPDFKATEKTVYMRAKERAGEFGQQAAEKAGELKYSAAKKIEDMRSSTPPKSN
jgi:sporulation protein YlmC with PRC-barrel domain